MGLCMGGSPLPSGFEPVRCPVATGTPKHENGGGLAVTRMRAGTPAFPVWVPAPRSESGTGFAGMTGGGRG